MNTNNNLSRTGINFAPKDGTKILGFDDNNNVAVIWWDTTYPNTGNWVYGEVEKDYINSWLYFDPIMFMYIPTINN